MPNTLYTQYTGNAYHSNTMMLDRCAHAYQSIQFWQRPHNQIEYPELAPSMVRTAQEGYQIAVREYYDRLNSEADSRNETVLSRVLATASGDFERPTSVDSYTSREAESNRPDSTRARPVTQEEVLEWLLP